jgi:hypothetical protein
MAKDMDSFTRQYIATALWSTTRPDDTFLDEDYNVEDIAADTLAKMQADCAKFQEEMAEHITDDNLLRNPDNDTAGTYGHDFWLTRNWHGAGFWDGDYREPAASALTACAKRFGEFDLYVGDDGKVHGYGG